MTRQKPYPQAMWISLMVACGLLIVVPPVAAVIHGTGDALNTRETNDNGSPPERTADRSHMSASDYGGAWPLTADEATVHCERQGRLLAVTADINGKRYAINGGARTLAVYPDLPRSLWKDNPQYPGLDIKIDISPLIERGLSLC